MKKIYLLAASILVAWLGFANPSLLKSSVFWGGLSNPVAEHSSKKPKAKPTIKKFKKHVIPFIESRAVSAEESSLYSLLVPSITATKSVAVQGGGNATVGGQLNYTIVVSNTGTDATAVTVTDVLVNDLTLVAGSLKATPIIVDDSYNCIGNVGITVPAGGGLLANDNSPTNEPITVTAVNTAGTSGTVTFNPDGSFTFLPNAGFRGATTFAYTITGSTSSLTSTGTVTITVSNPIWFIDASAPSGGNGRLASPFNSINNFNATSLDQAGDYIFIYSGTYTVTTSTLLLGQQKIYGQGAVGTSLASLAGITVPSFSNTLPSINGTRPEWNSSANPALNAQSQNHIHGLNITGSTGETMVGNGFTSMTVRNVSLNNTNGQAINFATGTLDVIFTSVSATGGTKGISVSSCTGSFQITGTSTTAGSGGTISNITNRGAEFVTVASVTLKNMNFVNANTAAGTCANAVSDNTGCNAGIHLQSISGGVTMDNIQMNTTLGNKNEVFGINMNAVNGFSLANSTITRCGTGNQEACLLAVNTTGTCTISNSTLSKASHASRFYNTNANMTLKVTDSNFNDTRTFHDPPTPTNIITYGNPDGSAGILFEGFGTSNMKLDVGSSCQFLRIASGGVDVTGADNAQVSADVQNSTFNSTNTNLPVGEDVGRGVSVVSSGSAVMKFNIKNNTITGRGGDLINIGTLSGGANSTEGTIEGNTITYNFQSTINNNAGNGIGIIHVSSATNSKVRVHNNTITGIRSSYGIDALVQGGTCNVVYTNNNVTVSGLAYDGTGGANSQPGSDYAMRIIASVAGGTACSRVANNTVTAGALGYAQMRASIVGTTHNLEGSPTTSNWDASNPHTNVWNFNSNLPNIITNTSPTFVSVGGNGTKNIVPSGTCLLPSNPPLSLRIAAPEEIATSEQSSEPIVSEEQDLTATTGDEATLTTTPEITTEAVAQPNQQARMMAGETVTVNGSGSGFILPANKSTTITFSATISNTPSTCAITNQATVSGSNFTTVNSNTTTTNVIVPPINSGSTISATSVCSGGTTTLGAACPSGSQLNWFTASSGGSSVSTVSPYSPTNITAATSYYASCTIGGCESTRTLVGSVTINASPTASPGSNTPVCVGNTLNLTSTTATSYLWTGPNSFSATTQNPNVNNVSIVAGGTYTLRVTNAGGCTATATTAVVINSTPAPTSPIATPSSRTTTGSVTLSASGCSGGTLTWYNASTNAAVPSPNNQPNLATGGTFNFYAKCTGTNTCVSNASANVPVTVTLCTPLASSPGNVGINWTGAVSTEWSDACNWNPAWVPDATNSAVVIDLQTNQPIISGTVPSVKLIYVNSGATLTVGSVGTLNASSTTAVLTLQGGNLINDGTINLSGGGTSVGLAIGATASITNRGTITTNNLYGVSLQFGNLTFTNESTGIITGDFKANNNILTLTNRGTINYAGGTYALSLGSAGSSLVNTGTISVTAGSGISNPSGSTISNNACGKILMTGGAGLYENGGTTTNAGLIQMLNLFDFTNTGIFTNNGVVKANTVSGITNNRMVITNACPIFTLSGSNNYTVSGIFTDAGTTTSAGTYTSVGNKFTANNTIPTGTQTLYAQVTNVPAEGFCTFVVPFDFNNRKPTAVSVNKTTICTGASVTLSASCSAGTPTWYTTETGGTSIGTGASLTQSPTNTATYYAACEATNCVSGRVATNEVTVSSPPNASANSNSPICAGATLNLNSGSEGNTYVWRGPNSFTSTELSPSISNATVSATGTYTITVTNASSCSSTATTAVTVNAVPSATASSNSPVCIGNTISLTGGGVGTYLWTGPNGYSSTAQSPTIANATVLATGTYTITVTGAGSCTSMATTAVMVNGISTASVTPNSQTICSGETITTMTITGTGTSYTWVRDNTGSVTGIAASGSGDISGSLTNTTEAPITVTFTITPVSACSGTPVTATVVVNPIPTVVASTPSQTICSGAGITGITFNNPVPTVTLSPDPSSDVTPVASKESKGIGLTGFVAGTVFNWTRDNTATVTGIPASGTGNISGLLTNTTASPVTVTFTVTPSFTNAGKVCTGTPITVTVTVNPNPTAPTITDAGTAFCSGSSTTLTASADPTYTSYAWERSLTGIANPNSFTAFGGTAQTQVVTTSGVYRVVVGNQYNCFARDTTAVKFGDFVFNGSLATGDAQQTGRMNRFAVVSTCASPKGYPLDFTTSGLRFYDSYTVTNPTSAPVCATIGLTSGCGTTLFSAAYLGSFNPTALSTNYLADHGSSFPTTAFYEATIPANGTIVVVVHEVNPGTGCSNYNLRVDVPGATVAATASSNSPICAGNTLNLTGTGTGTYAWSGPNSFTSTEQNPSIANATALATGTYTISVTNTSGCVFNATTAVTVNAVSTASVTPSTQTICSGETITTIAITGTSYTWTRNNTGSVTGIAASGSGDISGSLTNTTEAPVTVTFTVTPVGTCSGTPVTATVVVNPIPTVVASTPSQTICSGAGITGITFNNPVPTVTLSPDPSSDVTPVASKESKGIGLTGFVAGTVFNWTRDNTATVTGIPASGTGNISGLLTNTTASPITVTFTVTPSFTNAGKVCTGTPITVTVTVNPNPTAPTITDAGTAFCSGSSTTLTASADPTYTSYAWERSLTGIANPNSFTAFGGTAQTQVVTTSGVYRVVVGNQYNCFARDTAAVKFGDFVFNGSLATGDAQQTGRMNRFAVLSTCAAPKTYPGDFTTSGARFYDSYTVTNPTSAPVCATIGLTSGCGTSLFSAAYLGSFNPASVSTNYLADPGSSFPTTAFYEATIPANGTIVVVVHEVNSGTGCSNYNLRVDVPGATVAPTANSNSPICAGNTLNLTGTGTGTYAWSGPNSFTSTEQNPSLANATTLATGTYTISVTNTSGCVFNATTAVTVNPTPTATASNNSPICSGVTLQLTGGGVGTYAWAGPNSYSSTAQSPSITNATASTSGVYTITVTNANGCTAMATTSVTVNPVTATPTPQANTQIIFGGSVTLTATGCSGVNDVLKWYQSSDNSLAVMPVSPTVLTNYYAKCETTLNGITCISGNSSDVTVTVLSPTPPVATGATNCLGTPTTLTATGCSGSVGTFELKWYQNSDDALVTMPVSPTTTTDYYAKCEQTFNAVTAVSAKSNVVTLTILNPPTPVSTGGTIYNGQSITLTATGCTGTLGTFTLKWYQTSDNALVTTPISPTVTTQYYSKCEQVANSVTCLSAKSNDVTVTVVNRIFVDIAKVAAPIQNGNSWATAYGNLQTGLAAATAGVEVWVAKGTYNPTTTITRTIYFNIPNNVIVYGGFAGTEDNLIDRNFRTNATILSGDIGTLNVATDNSYHVVVMNGSSSTTVLDGFTITGGYANFDDKRTYTAPNSLVTTTATIETGGGIVVQNGGSPTIANCTIIQNAAVTGGGLYASDASTPTILFCKIMGNQAGFGSALYFQDGSHGKVSNTLISGNKGIGAVYNNNSNPMITNVTFGGNGGYNGGIFNSNSQPIVKNSIIWGNSTPFNDLQSIITNSIVQGGYAGAGNINYDPQFVSPVPDGLSPTINGDYHLQASSLAIDRGDNGTISLTDIDLDGNLRRYNGGKVDMGAYEFQGVGTSNVVISAQTGDWEINSTWVGFKVPQLGDVVIIDSNHIVTINTTATAKTVQYQATGQIQFKTASAKLNIGF